MRCILILFLLRTLTSQGQPDGLMEMVAAEKAFIEMARTQNRRDAFLFFLSDSAVTQRPEGPVKGKARIAAQPVTDDLLSWEIAYSDIAASGDFGFNTGPWNYRSKKTDEKPVAFGEFNSVWKKQPDGAWKNVLDIGISHGEPREGVTWTTTRMPSTKTTGGSVDPVSTTELEFLRAPSTAYIAALSSESRVMVSGHLPFQGANAFFDILAASPQKSNPVLLGSETASSGDMGYAYGTVDVSLTKDGKTETKKATYVRIWKREGGTWRIVLDVLSF